MTIQVRYLTRRQQNLHHSYICYFSILYYKGLNSDISLESIDKSLSTFKSDGEIDFRQGMLSSVTDELTRLLLNLDAGHFKKMLDETRNIVLEQDDEIKRNQNIIKELESKVN